MAEFEIHHQLRADCHYLCTLERSHLLLHRNAVVFWLVLVPETDVTELHDLNESQFREIMTLIKKLAEFAKHYDKADKINIATLGNIVPQLHIHIIARKKSDPCWPDAVWGKLETRTVYTEENIATLKTMLRNTFATNTS